MFGTEPPAVHMAPSMASVFPRFEGPDINFWLFCFSWRYRRLLRNWEDRVTSKDRRVNWTGMALNAFYAALRRALIVSIVIRASIVLGGLSTIAGWLYKRVQHERKKGRLLPS